jgi:hypothetical protein
MRKVIFNLHLLCYVFLSFWLSSSVKSLSW